MTNRVSKIKETICALGTDTDGVTPTSRASLYSDYARIADRPLAHAAKNTDASLQTALTQAARATFITQGRGRHIVYVFFDANCAYCPLLYRNLPPLIEPNNLQLRWIPVAIVDATSLGKAAAILELRPRRTILRTRLPKLAATIRYV